mmetsp:Transcript_35490/g.55767  ORF Transcript_35490/g.55767 Transcript_35490/m.55767 type:complete len:160 (+) Transcript_35490:1257-1736(+)
MVCICKHSLALAIMEQKTEVPPGWIITSLPQLKKRGRPSNASTQQTQTRRHRSSRRKADDGLRMAAGGACAGASDARHAHDGAGRVVVVWWPDRASLVFGCSRRPLEAQVFQNQTSFRPLSCLMASLFLSKFVSSSIAPPLSFTMNLCAASSFYFLVVI